MELEKKFSLLRYLTNQKWQPLPGWARFFLELGINLAATNFEEKKYVVALALPTRSYAASLIGAGFSFANFFIKSHENAEYIQFIHSLPEGTPVKFFENNTMKKGLKKDLLEYQGALHVGIQLEGGTTRYISPQNVRKIQVTDKQFNHLPNHQKGRKIIPPSELLDTLIPGKVNEYAYQTRIDGVIMGSRNTLRVESLLPLAILDQGRKKILQGSLQDLFRVSGFLPPSIGYRFVILPPSANNYETGLLKNFNSETVIVFDNPLGFLKWREAYRNQNWVVILDHTDTNFSNAIAQMNQEYLYRSETAINISIPPIPSGMEMMFFLRDI